MQPSRMARMNRGCHNIGRYLNLSPLCLTLHVLHTVPVPADLGEIRRTSQPIPRLGFVDQPRPLSSVGFPLFSFPFPPLPGLCVVCLVCRAQVMAVEYQNLTNLARNGWICGDCRILHRHDIYGHILWTLAIISSARFASSHAPRRRRRWWWWWWSVSSGSTGSLHGPSKETPCVSGPVSGNIRVETGDRMETLPFQCNASRGPSLFD